MPPAKPECPPPLEEEIVDRVVFYEKLSFLWAVLWASNKLIPKMLWRPGLRLDPTGRTHAPTDFLLRLTTNATISCKILVKIGTVVLAENRLTNGTCVRVNATGISY